MIDVTEDKNMHRYFHGRLVLLWDAINEYVESCGGDTSNKSDSERRFKAVSKIHRMLEEERVLTIRDFIKSSIKRKMNVKSQYS
jgi:hypothetical protein